MHHNNLYQVTNFDDPVFVNLVNLVKSEAGVPNTRNWEHKVPSKCEALINTSTKAWERDGILVARNKVIMKSPLFQYLWDCTVQAAQVSSSTYASAEQNPLVGKPGNEASSASSDSVTPTAKTSENNCARKVVAAVLNI